MAAASLDLGLTVYSFTFALHTLTKLLCKPQADYCSSLPKPGGTGGLALSTLSEAAGAGLPACLRLIPSLSPS